MPLLRTSSGRSFHAEVGETILDASLRADLSLPYSCRTGRCSSCKAKVLAGSTHAIRDEPGLTEAELRDGWVLACARTADTDAEFEVEDFGAFHPPAPKLVPCRIQSLETAATDVLRVVLRMPAQVKFDFTAGQYVEIIGPGGLRRSYSIANAPRPNPKIELLIKRMAGGAMSRYWFEQAAVNDLLRLNGPIGTFFLRRIDDVDLIFLGTGTGIAPIKAMLESLAQSPGRPRSATVLWGVRRREDLFWTAPPGDPACEFVPVLSRADKAWTGARGYVQQVLEQRPQRWQHSDIYACGSMAMIRDARQLAARLGILPNQFHADAFVCSTPP